MCADLSYGTRQASAQAPGSGSPLHDSDPQSPQGLNRHVRVASGSGSRGSGRAEGLVHLSCGYDEMAPHPGATVKRCGDDCQEQLGTSVKVV